MALPSKTRTTPSLSPPNTGASAQAFSGSYDQHIVEGTAEFGDPSLIRSPFSSFTQSLSCDHTLPYSHFANCWMGPAWRKESARP